MRALVEAKADLEARDKDGQTALIKAASFGKVEAVRALLAKQVAVAEGERARSVRIEKDMKDAVKAHEKALLGSCFVCIGRQHTHDLQHALHHSGDAYGHTQLHRTDPSLAWGMTHVVLKHVQRQMHDMLGNRRIHRAHAAPHDGRVRQEVLVVFVVAVATGHAHGHHVYP